MLYVQVVYNQYRFPEGDNVEVLAAAATKHLKLLKEKDMAFIIEVANWRSSSCTIDVAGNGGKNCH